MNACENQNTMLIASWGKRLTVCYEQLECETTDNLLCEVVQKVIENGYMFLLDIIYPWKLIETDCGIEKGGLVVASVPVQDGFCLLKSIPISQILVGQIDISFEDITLEERLAYIKRLLAGMPCYS